MSAWTSLLPTSLRALLGEICLLIIVSSKLGGTEMVGDANLGVCSCATSAS
jgi:hypothetical protein